MSAPSPAEPMACPAKWTDDCSGKKNFDGNLVTLSTRYWPRGGGFLIVGPATGGRLVDSAEIAPDMRPSAHATIYLGSTENDHFDNAVNLVDREFEADTQQEVQAQVEAWAAEQFARVGTALRAEFRRSPSPATTPVEIAILEKELFTVRAGRHEAQTRVAELEARPAMDVEAIVREAHSRRNMGDEMYNGDMVQVTVAELRSLLTAALTRNTETK